MYSPEQLEQLETAKADTLRKSFKLTSRVMLHEYRTEKAQEYARHGFARRLWMLDHSLNAVFEKLPPGSAKLPSRHAVLDATVFLQSFVINCYGAFDNLAHIWVAERELPDRSGKPVRNTDIGLAPKYAKVRESLPPALSAKLRTYDEWFGYLENYRHSLAHRIPLYIADRAYRPSDLEKFEAIRAEKAAAYGRLDYDAIHRLMDEESQIGVFNPLMMHSFGEQASPMYFHSQMLCDHATVVEFASAFLDALNP